MLNGCLDENFPIETSQRPLFDEFPSPNTGHYLLSMGHGNPGGQQREKIARRILSWLDLSRRLV